jgi:hypothetical protein
MAKPVGGKIAVAVVEGEDRLVVEPGFSEFVS